MLLRNPSMDVDLAGFDLGPTGENDDVAESHRDLDIPELSKE